MTRVGWLLTTLLCILLVVGWYFLLFSPTSDEIADVRAETDQVVTEATQQRARAAQLREIRLNAPEAEAALNAGQLVIPEEPAMPALFRQLQQAADDAGVRLQSINPGAPSATTINGQDVASIGISLSLEGSYFQMVDFARRIEDPLLTPRALRWDAASLAPTEFPELTVSFGGQVYSRGVAELPTMEDPAEEVTLDEADEAGDPEADESDEVTP